MNKSPKNTKNVILESKYSRDEQKMNPLHAACKGGQLNIVKLLVGEKINITFDDNEKIEEYDKVMEEANCATKDGAL